MRQQDLSHASKNQIYRGHLQEFLTGIRRLNEGFSAHEEL